jgi:hypothetical protein
MNVSQKSLTIFIAATLFFTSIFALPAAGEKVYDVQCACYAHKNNAERLVSRLTDLGLPWYTIPSGRTTRFIIDLNITSSELNTFTQAYPEFPDAFLVNNHWDLPLPHPEMIDPLPGKERFVSVMSTYMQQQYKKGYYNKRQRSMARETAEMYTSFIYDASSYYDLDPFLLFAVGNLETYFRNMYGDLDRLKFKTPDPAQGIFQILKSTSRHIYRDMKRKKLPHAPAEPPENFLRLPKTQVYFAAHHLHGLFHRHFDNRYMALLAYNSPRMRNYDYARRVMRFYQRAINYYRTSSEEWSAEACLSSPSRQDRGSTSMELRALQ